MCVDDIPLSKGKSWKFSKFHELLHLLDNMECFGAPRNYCAPRPESLLIPVAKKPGRRTKNRHNGSAYELQSAQHLSHLLMVNAVYTHIWEPTNMEPVVTRRPGVNGTLDTECSTGNATFATLTCDL